MPSGSTDSGTALVELMRVYEISQPIYVAASLGIADRLADRPRSYEDLAHDTGTCRVALPAVASTGEPWGVRRARRRAVRADAVVGAIARRCSRLCPGPRDRLGHPTHWQAWGRLLDSVRTGRPSFDLIYGKSHYEHLATDREDRAMFRAGMAANQTHALLAEVYDLPEVSQLVDVGGGNGRLLAAVLAKHRDMRGVLFDTAPVVTTAEAVLRAAGVVEHCRIIAGDFLVAVPAGADAYVVSNVLMDCDDLDAITLLGDCRAVMVATGRLLAVERVIPADNAPSLAQINDVMALTVIGGRIRTEREFAALFAASGFSLINVVATPVDHYVLEARPV